jgi:hypothetical protein
MNYLTNFYKNKYEQLQEHYNYLMNIVEDSAVEMSDSDVEKWINDQSDAQVRAGGRPLTPEEKESYRARINKRRSERSASEQNTRVSAEQEAAERAAQSERQRTAAEAFRKAAEERARKQAAADEANRARANSPEEQARRARQAEEAVKRRTSGTQTADTLKTEAPPVAPKPVRSGSLGGRIGTGVAGLGVGYATDETTRAGLEALGVKNQDVLDIAGTAANVGIGGATEVALSSYLGGAGAGTALGLGAGAILPLAAAGAIGTVAGKTIEKGADIPYKIPVIDDPNKNARSTLDRLGNLFYSEPNTALDMALGIRPLTRAINNLIAGNPINASTKDLNTGGKSKNTSQSSYEEKAKKSREALSREFAQKYGN